MYVSLHHREASCKIQLLNADKLVGGLGGEETRWKQTVEHLKEVLHIFGNGITWIRYCYFIRVLNMTFTHIMTGLCEYSGRCDCLRGHHLVSGSIYCRLQNQPRQVMARWAEGIR